MSDALRPGKLLICLVGRHRGEQLVNVAKEAGARGGTIAMARSSEGGRIMQALSLDNVQQDMVIILMTEESKTVLAAIKQAAKETPKKLGGIAILLDVSQMLIRVAQGSTLRQELIECEYNPMQSNYKLITIIVNHGYADDVMQAARKAGATGGTIITARGTGTEEDVKFFGISLVPEKELLMIVAEKNKVKEICQAVGKTPNLCKPGGGIIFNMNVEEFIVLGS